MRKADLLSVLTTHTYTKTKQKGKELLAVMEIFITMIVVMVSWMHVYVQINQIVHVKYVQYFFVYQLYPNKAVKIELKRMCKKCAKICIHRGFFSPRILYKSGNWEIV